ncbi:iron ABC transporter permease [Hyphococcus flavus]|uniref:Iron ABC transporter permease n=1 Tax=Hyphococcus flavus TaxID=1866326 RepID=A0AAE9ZGG2_9PROT|nr:iron ABC transporter permease [Hyphococcus flavus]WDI32312.1 iron ABC transporter permease [Hyphococcus flavus]
MAANGPEAHDAQTRRPARVARLCAIIAVSAFVAAPIAAVLASATIGGKGEALAHLLGVNGVRYFVTTLALCALAGLGASIIGAVSALLISMTDFPGRRLLSIALVLPFAIPAYVAAYAYGDLLGPFGPVAQLVGVNNIPEIRSLSGAAFVLMLMTYPYVYLAMTASLSSRSSSLMQAARMLGASPLRASLGLLLTASRPAFFGGLALALMEIAAEYGVADFFGVQTLSVGIFRTWYGLGDLAAATQIATGLFLVALVLTIIESASRKGRAAEDVRAHRSSKRLKLSGVHAFGAICICAAPVVFGFIAPAGVLLAKFDPDLSIGAGRDLAAAGVNTASIAAIGAIIAMAIAVILSYAARRARGRIAKSLMRVATLGYAVPGAVMAIGILALSSFVARISGVAVAGGIGVLLYAYVARFLTAGYNSASAGLAQISPEMDAAARSLGAGPARVLSFIHWPMARSSVLAGAGIVAIDIAKELPATLLLRPFNFETLSTRIYRLASDERLADAAPAALILIALGLIPALALSLIADHSNWQKKNARKADKDFAGAEAGLTV